MELFKKTISISKKLLGIYVKVRYFTEISKNVKFIHLFIIIFFLSNIFKCPFGFLFLILKQDQVLPVNLFDPILKT